MTIGYHPSEEERLIRLEERINNMKERETKLEHDLDALKKELRSTNKKINTAESWGRAIIYSGIAIGGLLTQVQSIADWLKK